MPTLKSWSSLNQIRSVVWSVDTSQNSSGESRGWTDSKSKFSINIKSLFIQIYIISSIAQCIHALHIHSLPIVHPAHSNPYAPHVPQPRTHGAPQRPSAPHVPQTRTHGAPGRWRKYIKAWRRVGRFREAEKEAEEDGSGLNSATHMKPRPAPEIGPKRARPHMKPRPVSEIGHNLAQPQIKKRPVPEMLKKRARDVRCVKDVRYVKDVKN